MNRACKDRRGGQRSGVSRWFGLGLMLVGVILLLCSLPSWLWMSVSGHPAHQRRFSALEILNATARD